MSKYLVLGGGGLFAAFPLAYSIVMPALYLPVIFMLLGLIWIIVFYVSQSQLPIPTLGSWNILIGFGIMFIGFLMTTRWR